MIVPALFVFFLSGVAALLYQVIWQRLLVMFSGADVYSSTIIVAAFMAGLGAGSLAGGYLADRSSRRTSLLLFAGAELSIGLFSILSRPLFYDVLYHRLGPLAIPAPAMAVVLFFSLLWPTFFMGMSLPLLARALTARLDRAPAILGALYGINTLGAATGAITATWWMLPAFGLDVSLRFASAINIACAVVVLPLIARMPKQAAAESTSEAVGTGHGSSVSDRFILWAIASAFSGFLALSLEMVWFRLLGVMVKSTAFTFGTLLAIYLAGLGAGSMAGGILAPRLRRPASVFLALQSAVGLTAAAALSFLVAASEHTQWLREYFGRYESLDVRENVAALYGALGVGGAEPAAMPWLFLRMYVLVPAALVLPSTFCMGLTFPVLQRGAQTDLGRLGRRVGLLLVANIAGSVAGTVLTGWVMLTVFGTAGTVKALLVLSGAFVVAAAMVMRRVDLAGSGNGLIAIGVAAATLLVAFRMPDAPTLWSRLHGVDPTRIVFGEDASGLSVLRVDKSPDTTVFVNGLGQSNIPYGEVHTALGMLPAFLHDNPRRAAVIGLGSGDTVHAVAGRQELERITSIEIIHPQLDTLRRYSTQYPYGGVLNLLGDKRIEQISGDGRIYLMHAGRDFDIIEADALRPTSAYSGNLFSEEYFQLLRDRLRPGGLAATWSPTERVHNAFVRVFPYVISVPGILIGSESPIAVDRAAIAERIADPRVRAHYSRAFIDVERMISEYLANPAKYTPAFNRARLTDFNTDLFPKDEFDLSPRK